MKRAATLLALLCAGCGSTQTASQFGEVPLLLPAQVSGNDAGVYFASARTYDQGEGAELLPSRQGDADFRITADPPAGCITVMAIVPPDELVLCVDEVILQDDRAKVLAVVRALQRGYTQAQKEPEEAITAMTTALPDANREELAASLDDVAASWTAGQPFFGAVQRGDATDSSVALEANEQRSEGD
ncbi:hypothetical protein DVA67_026420 [Solirubrobacter sp. CPCC 204708]|uniref:ABC transporter substrate-binding protein n=1 Tax=Solirubrobacter deserti TaxID=2282478 RepID=A0ABT4RF64_9ACTN|nr:hypothetical protein [Solirubrobacter deserti]MBE2319530.1 hypothetical protein [Solirubrobacter deserti]MDA0137183.1 ABC transporter substrate-binding protein [Solirubrobacter deserti]